VFSELEISRSTFNSHPMTFLLSLLLWFILLVLSWPLAFLALLLWPIFWLLSIPFRIVAFVIGAMLAFLKGILLLPARLLGVR
jgi:hypothetical protein